MWKLKLILPSVNGITYSRNGKSWKSIGSKCQNQKILLLIFLPKRGHVLPKWARGFSSSVCAHHSKCWEPQLFPGGGGSSSKYNQDAIPACTKASVTSTEWSELLPRCGLCLSCSSSHSGHNILTLHPSPLSVKGWQGNALISLLTQDKSPLQKTKGTTDPAYGSSAFPTGI